MIAYVHSADSPTATRVVLRGPLVGDVTEDDAFEAIVTVTGTRAGGLPLLQVTELEVS
ncbi:hypothetical protein [Paractinoplanes durhamensis]|uniref:hypothetical protein n=1 Tax=Paractinoplanes durhamensis TaxID=113563 RepID=UPI003638934F